MSSVTFSPDGTTLASGGSEGSIKLWALPSGSLLVTLVPTPNGWAGILPDGRYLAMGDATKHIWHVAGLVRFEAGSLDRWLDTPLRLPPDTNLMRLARAQLE